MGEADSPALKNPLPTIPCGSKALGKAPKSDLQVGPPLPQGLPQPEHCPWALRVHLWEGVGLKEVTRAICPS